MSDDKTVQVNPKEKARLEMLCAMLDKMNVSTCGVIQSMIEHGKKEKAGTPSSFDFIKAGEEMNKVLGGVVALQRLFNASIGVDNNALVSDVAKIMPSMEEVKPKVTHDIKIDEIIGEDGILSQLVSSDVVAGGKGNYITKDSPVHDTFINDMQPHTAVTVLNTGLYRFSKESVKPDCVVIKSESDDNRKKLVVWRFEGEGKDVFIVEDTGRAMRLTVSSQPTINRIYSTIAEIAAAIAIQKAS